LGNNPKKTGIAFVIQFSRNCIELGEWVWDNAKVCLTCSLAQSKQVKAQHQTQLLTSNLTISSFFIK
jgi:hypothetical protein